EARPFVTLLNITTLNPKTKHTYEHTITKWIHADLPRHRLVQGPLARTDASGLRPVDDMVQPPEGSRHGHRRQSAGAGGQDRVRQEPRGLRRAVCRIEGN